MTYKKIKKNAEVRTYIEKSDEFLGSLGLTEHSFTHAELVAEKSGYMTPTSMNGDIETKKKNIIK